MVKTILFAKKSFGLFFCEIHNRAIPLYYWTGWLDETSYPSLEINPALAAHYRAKLSEFNDKQIAHAAQRITEKKLTQLIGRLREEYASDSIILSGGLFANVRLNLEVKRQGFKNIFVCPPMGDEGLAIGAAVLARKELYGSTLKNEPVRDLFWARQRWVMQKISSLSLGWFIALLRACR